LVTECRDVDAIQILQVKSNVGVVSDSIDAIDINKVNFLFTRAHRYPKPLKPKDAFLSRVLDGVVGYGRNSAHISWRQDRVDKIRSIVDIWSIGESAQIE
jgi:hypothetical protein